MLNRAVVISVPDNSAADADACAAYVIDELSSLDATLVHREATPASEVEAAIERWRRRCDLLFLLGDVGPASSLPEAATKRLARPLPGVGELLRRTLMEIDLAHAGQRPGAGVLDDALLVWLPNAPDLCQRCLEQATPAIKKTCQELRGALE